MTYEETPAKRYNKIKIRGNSKVEKVKVNTQAKADYNKAKAEHRTRIKEQRKLIRGSHIKVIKTVLAEAKFRRSAGKAIRKHKLLRRQARLLFKLSR